MLFAFVAFVKEISVLLARSEVFWKDSNSFASFRLKKIFFQFYRNLNFHCSSVGRCVMQDLFCLKVKGIYWYKCTELHKLLYINQCWFLNSNYVSNSDFLCPVGWNIMNMGHYVCDNQSGRSKAKWELVLLRWKKLSVEQIKSKEEIFVLNFSYAGIRVFPDESDYCFRVPLNL